MACSFCPIAQAIEPDLIESTMLRQSDWFDIQKLIDRFVQNHPQSYSFWTGSQIQNNPLDDLKKAVDIINADAAAKVEEARRRKQAEDDRLAWSRERLARQLANMPVISKDSLMYLRVSGTGI